jgi:hypothetical protein
MFLSKNLCVGAYLKAMIFMLLASLKLHRQQAGI